MTASCTVMLMDVRPGERLSISGAATISEMPRVWSIMLGSRTKIT